MRHIVVLAASAILFGTVLTAGAEEWELGEGNKAFQHLPQYQSYLKNYDDTQMTEYGGSVPHRKHDDFNPLPKGYKHASRT